MFEQLIREMERQQAGRGSGDSRFGARSTSVRQEIVRTSDGRSVLRTSTSTVSPDGSHTIETSEQELPVGQGFGGGFGGFGGPFSQGGFRPGGPTRSSFGSKEEETAWRKEQAVRQQAMSEAAQGMASTMTGVLWRALKQSVVRAVRRRIDPLIDKLLGRSGTGKK